MFMQNESEFNDSLVHAFWRHVVETPDQIGFIVKDHDPPINAEPRGDPVTSYRSVTWGEAGFIVASIMVLLKDEWNFKRFDRAVILSWSRAEWVWITLAAWTAGGITVGIDPRYGYEQVAYLLNDCNSCESVPESRARVVFVEDESQHQKVFASGFDLSATAVVSIPEMLARIHASTHSFDAAEIQLCAAAQVLVETIAYDLGDFDVGRTALLLYTSGSRGEPKGVILTHRNLVLMSMLVSQKVKLSSNDLLLGQLPSNHVFMWNGIGPCLWSGIPAFYCHPLEMKVHLKTLKPTILFGVPKVWLSIYNEVKRSPELHLPFLPQFVRTNINLRLAALKGEILGRALLPSRSRLNAFCNGLVSMALRAALGGRLRIRISGGAPLPAEIAEFFRLCHQEIMNGYGATETVGCISVETEDEKRKGSAGRLLESIVVLFESSDTQSDLGVMQIGGPTISQGYWNKPAQTAASFIGGKFRSGDLGRLDDDGYLYIGAREDDDGKLANGEKVSAQEIAEFFRDSKLIEHIVPVFAGKPVVKALIFIREATARKLLAERSIKSASSDSLQLLAKHQILLEEIRAEIAEINDRLGKKGEWKRIRDFEIVPETATTANGFLTVKMEISAKRVMNSYAALIEEMFRRDSVKMNPQHS